MTNFIVLSDNRIIECNKLVIKSFKILQTPLHKVFHKDLGKGSLIHKICEDPNKIFHLKDEPINLLKLFCGFQDIIQYNQKYKKHKISHLNKKINNSCLNYLKNAVSKDKKADFILKLLNYDKSAWERLRKEDIVGFYFLAKKMNKIKRFKSYLELDAIKHLLNFKIYECDIQTKSFVFKPSYLESFKEYLDNHEKSREVINQISFELKKHRIFCLENKTKIYENRVNILSNYRFMIDQILEENVISRCDFDENPFYPEIKLFNLYLNYFENGNEIEKSDLQLKKFKTDNEKWIRKYIMEKVKILKKSI